MKTKQSFKELITSTKRTLYVNDTVVDEIEPCEQKGLEVFTLEKYVTNDELEREASKLGFELAHPYAFVQYVREHPDVEWLATQWKDKAGNWCFAGADGWFGGRELRVGRNGRGRWDGLWSFVGLRKSSDLVSSESSPESLSALTSRIESLEQWRRDFIKVFK